MAHSNNYIDLTGESDDDSKTRVYFDAGLPPRSMGNPFHSTLAPQHYRDGASSTIPARSTLHSHHRQYPPSHQHMGVERRPHIPTAPRHFTLSQSLLNSKDAGRMSTGPQRLTSMVTPARSTLQRHVCVNCTEGNVTCDGERPCSACVEPGLLCYYPGEKTTDLNNRRSPNQVAKHKASPLSVSRDPKIPPSISDKVGSQFKSPSHLPTHITKQSDLLPNRLLNAGALSLDLRAGQTIEQEAFDDSDESDDDDVPLAIAEFEEVKRLLKKHEARMRDHRAYLLQPLLNQAKLDAVKAPGPLQTSRRVNPFASLIAKARNSDSVSSGKSQILQVQLKSHKLGAPKKWTQVTVPLKTLDTDPTILPKYKSIGRLGTSLLAPNIRTLKYWPYFPDEENLDPSEAKKNEELEERYQHDDNHLLAQRKCSELVDMWRPWVKDFVSKLRIEFSDILYWFLQATDQTACDTCERDVIVADYTEVSKLLPKPTDRSLALAKLATSALRDVTNTSMWHFVLEASSVKDLMGQIEAPKKSTTTLCSVCFLHNCLSHGAYLEPEESGGAVIMGGNVEINDEESNHNVRQSASLPNHGYEGEHQCGLYCVAAEVRVKDILGRRKDGTIGGIHNHAIHVPRLSLNNDTICSDSCYWPVEKRARFGTVLQTKEYQPKLSEGSKQLFRQLLRIYSDNQRVPCMLAKDIDGLECVDAFYLMLAETQRVSHYRQAVANSMQQGRKVSKLAAGLDVSLSADLDERPPFIPCSHLGPCLNNPECTCAQNKVHCEWFCGCDTICDRRFPGCKCASANKTCFNDKSCECWKHNRECDPWVCGTCGVVEVLDPQTKYNDEIRKGRCKNNRIQLELPARTIKAPSEVQGWGLYAGVNMEEHAFIGEYKGETVGNQESDRRGAVYANIGQEYLFVMNRDQQIDGSNFGNKTRFINNSQRDDYINVFAKKLLCNGIQRVMLYAKKPILAGEELLYNYNYPVSVTKKFWERGEGPTNVPGAVVAKPSITWTQPRVNGRFAKVAGKQDGEQSLMARGAANGGQCTEEGDSASRRDTKRKRVSEGDLLLMSTGGPAAPKDDSGLKEPLGNGVAQFPDDPEDSDFESIETSGSSESVDQGEEGSEQGEDGASKFRKRRVVYPHDRRRGGLAQAKAWETRRRRIGKGK